MGGKRVKIDANFLPEKCGKRSFVGNDDDRISQLPDGVLVDLLSLLSMKEAARTTVLSSRWINLWKHTHTLKFDTDQSVFDKLDEQREILKSERCKFKKWVKSVIQSHESLTLKEFKIHFPLNKSSKKEITRWLQFAFSRQVQRLELDLDNYNDQPKDYCFPDQLLIRTSRKASKLQPLPDSVCIDHPRMLVFDFKSLKALVFKSVSVSDEAVKFFLDNCPLLEKLIVHDSYQTSNLEICGSSLMLKHLEIVRCYGLRSLKVSAPRLTTLTVPNIEGLLLENVPVLVDVSIMQCGEDVISMKHLFDVLSCCISQLQTFWLVLCGRDIRGGMDDLCELPEMPKLKKLVIEYIGNGDENLIRLAAFIRVSPYLEEFELKFRWFYLKDRQAKHAITTSPHNHLKVFKFGGYYGRTTDAVLLGYILENCVVLEKIIVDHSCVLKTHEIEGLDVEQIARKNAKQQLEQLVPRHVQLVIL